eukprot:scaffold23495_cov112-Isochrysis_galbana.AAC.4
MPEAIGQAAWRPFSLASPHAPTYRPTPYHGGGALALGVSCPPFLPLHLADGAHHPAGPAFNLARPAHGRAPLSSRGGGAPQPPALMEALARPRRVQRRPDRASRTRESRRTAIAPSACCVAPAPQGSALASRLAVHAHRLCKRLGDQRGAAGGTAASRRL